MWARIVGSINIMHEKGLVPHSSLKNKVKDDSTTKFWSHVWIGETPLKDRFSCLFRLNWDHDCLISDRWINGWIWSWTGLIIEWVVKMHLVDFITMLEGVTITSDREEWIELGYWLLRYFCVKETWLHIDKLNPTDNNTRTRWSPYVPSKVNIQVWRD